MNILQAALRSVGLQRAGAAQDTELRDDETREGEALQLNDPEIVRILGDAAGSQSASGQLVTAASAMRNTVLYACIRVIAETMASLPLKVYRRLPGGGKAEESGHTLYRVLHTQANALQTAFEFRENLFGHLKLWGNAFAEIEMNDRADVLGLWPLRPDRMEIVRTDQGEIVYVYTRPNGEKVGLPRFRVMHLREMSVDGLVGLSPIAQARNAIGLGMATEEYGSRFFKNGASPGTVLKHPGKLSEKAYQRLLGSWEARHQGLSNAMRTAIIEEGMSLENLGVPNRDAEFLETRKYQALEMCRLYRVAPHMVQILDNATFSNIEHQGIEFATMTVRPNSVRFEQVIGRDLIGAREGVSLFAEHVLDGLLRGDTPSRYAAYAIGRQWGWLSSNDVRGMENLNPIVGGDRYDVPLNMADAAASVAPAAPAARDAFGAWRADICARAAARMGASRDAKHRAWLIDALTPLAEARGLPDPAAASAAAASEVLGGGDLASVLFTAGF